MIKIIREIGKAFMIGSLIFLIVGFIEFINGTANFTGPELLRDFMYNQLYAVCLYMANMPFFYYIIKKYGVALFNFRNLMLAFLGNIGLTLVALFFINLMIVVVLEGRTVTSFLQNQAADQYIFSLLISIVVTTVFYVFYYYKFRQETKVTQQKIIAKTASAQFDALKNQLDPHFLFNSLNVLTSLIEENPLAATKFTTSLSKVYRYVLEQKSKELVTVDEELKFARLYMTLIKMRFEDSIIFDAPETISNPEAKVVPLSLQLLLENAVKHNQVTPSKKLHIKIFEENGNLVIQNNLQPKSVIKESSGVGLQNIHQRYALLTDRPFTVQKSKKEFSARIPMLTQISRVTKTQDSYISDKRYERATEHVKKLKGFYGHFAIYCLFIPVFVYLNFKSGTSFPWAIFPIAGWGMGVVGHASETFNWNPFFSKDWETRKIKQFMEEDE